MSQPFPLPMLSTTDQPVGGQVRLSKSSNQMLTGGGGAVEPTEKLLDQAEAEIKERFSDSLDNEVMAEILRVAVELRAARITMEAV